MSPWCTLVARTSHGKQGPARSEVCAHGELWYVQGAGQVLALESTPHHGLFRLEVLVRHHLIVVAAHGDGWESAPKVENRLVRTQDGGVVGKCRRSTSRWRVANDGRRLVALFV